MKSKDVAAPVPKATGGGVTAGAGATAGGGTDAVVGSGVLDDEGVNDAGTDGWVVDSEPSDGRGLDCCGGGDEAHEGAVGEGDDDP